MDILKNISDQIDKMIDNEDKLIECNQLLLKRIEQLEKENKMQDEIIFAHTNTIKKFHDRIKNLENQHQ